MKVHEFREMLEQLGTVYAVAGSNGPAAELALLANGMRTSDDQDFQDYLQDIQERLAKPTRPNAGAAARTSAIATYIAALKDAGLDEARFLAAFEALEADGSLKNAALDEIGIGYTEVSVFPRLFKSRAEKIAEIKRSFYERLGFETRGKVVDSVVPWQ
jgi:hypothetical protein